MRAAIRDGSDRRASGTRGRAPPAARTRPLPRRRTVAASGVSCAGPAAGRRLIGHDDRAAAFAARLGTAATARAGCAAGRAVCCAARLGNDGGAGSHVAGFRDDGCAAGRARLVGDAHCPAASPVRRFRDADFAGHRPAAASGTAAPRTAAVGGAAARASVARAAASRAAAGARPPVRRRPRNRRGARPRQPGLRNLAVGRLMGAACRRGRSRRRHDRHRGRGSRRGLDVLAERTGRRDPDDHASPAGGRGGRRRRRSRRPAARRPTRHSSPSRSRTAAPSRAPASAAARGGSSARRTCRLGATCSSRRWPIRIQVRRIHGGVHP